MLLEKCYYGVCFIPLKATAPVFFGFSEFLTGLALMVLAWTIADVRYRFRIRTAPIPLQSITFGVVALVGVLALLTDLWRAQEWYVPHGNLLTPAIWQAILAGLFLMTFLTWTWFAFIKPPIFGKRNARRYAQTLYTFVLKSSPTDLAIAADELTFSAKALVQYATNIDEHERYQDNQETRPEPPMVEAYANDILLLIADKRFCRSVVQSSPATALVLFQEMGDSKKYGIQVGTFAKNIINEAIINKESFLYHEAEGYESGLLGYIKPMSQAMFTNYQLVERVKTMFDPDIVGMSKWDAEQWDAYCRMVLMTFEDYVDKKRFWHHSFVLYRAISHIEQAVYDLYKLDGLSDGALDNDSVRRLQVVVNFIRDAVRILDKKGVPEYIRLRNRNVNDHSSKTFYDYIASMIFDVIFHASSVRSPLWECWSIQHNSVWSRFFSFQELDCSAGRVVKFKLRRLLYDEVVRMKSFPNFKGAKILGFCLNVMGLELRQDSLDKDNRALHKAILNWTKKNYAWLHDYNPKVAEHCLVDGLTYEADKLRIVKTYQADGLRREASYVYLDIDSNSSTELGTEQNFSLSNGKKDSALQNLSGVGFKSRIFSRLDRA